MWHEIFMAMCLVLVIEGILPFASPTYWRRVVANMAQLDDRAMRMGGLMSMLVGVGCLYLIN